MLGMQAGGVRELALAEKAPVADERFVEALRRYGAQRDIVALGVTTAEPFHDVADILRRRHAQGRKSRFEPADIDRRVDPQQLLPGARSLISIAISYHSGGGGEPVRPPRTRRIDPALRPVPDGVYDRPDRLRGRRLRRQLPGGPVAGGAGPDPASSGAGGHRGWVSRHAWGRDYHKVVGERLAALGRFITDHFPGTQWRAYVDTGPPVDRAVAQRAGVGWIGKNCCLFVPGAGSLVVLGTLVTTLALPPDDPGPEPFQECGDCDLCIRACPTGALVGPGDLEPSLCLAEATVLKGSIPLPLREPLGNRIYGCDTCQQVCPYNRDLPAAGSRAFLPVGPWDTGPDLQEIIGLTKREFREHYGDRASGWRGKSVIQRNAVYALGNYADPETVPLLGRLLDEDPRPAVRGAAAWALGRVGNAEARRRLARAVATETDPQVRAEIHQAMAHALPAVTGPAG